MPTSLHRFARHADLRSSRGCIRRALERRIIVAAEARKRFIFRITSSSFRDCFRKRVITHPSPVGPAEKGGLEKPITILSGTSPFTTERIGRAEKRGSLSSRRFRLPVANCGEKMPKAGRKCRSRRRKLLGAELPIKR